MPEVDAELVSALRVAKSTPVFFAFVAKGASDGALIASKKKIAAKQVNEAKKSCGGKLVFKGRCFSENGKMVFELPKEPPGTLAKQLKTVIHRDAGMTLAIETRLGADLETDDEDTSSEDVAANDAANIPEAPPLQDPSPEAAKVKARLKALAPVLQKAETTGSPQTQQARQQFNSANEQYAAEQYDQAGATLSRVEALIKEAFTSAANAAAAPATGANRVATRLKALAPALQQAAKTATPQANQARERYLEAGKLHAAGQVDAASAALDQAEALIKQALTTAASQAAAQPAADASGQTSANKPAQAPANDAGLQAQWEQRIIAIEPRVLEAKKTRPDQAKWMTMFMSVQDLGEAGKFKQALEVLDRIENLLNSPVNTTGPDLSLWQGVRSEAIAQLRTLAGEVKKSADPDVAKALVLIDSIVKNLTEKPATVKEVNALENYLRNDEVVADACMAFNIRDPLLGALAELKQQLAA